MKKIFLFLVLLGFTISLRHSLRIDGEWVKRFKVESFYSDEHGLIIGIYSNNKKIILPLVDIEYIQQD